MEFHSKYYQEYRHGDSVFAFGWALTALGARRTSPASRQGPDQVLVFGLERVALLGLAGPVEQAELLFGCFLGELVGQADPCKHQCCGWQESQELL